MTLKEAAAQFHLSYELLEKYVDYGFIQSEKGNEYCENDFKNIGLIQLLSDMGFTTGETRKYLLLSKSLQNAKQQINMLSARRRHILNEIHVKQKLLDNLDYIIWELKKVEKKGE